MCINAIQKQRIRKEAGQPGHRKDHTGGGDRAGHNLSQRDYTLRKQEYHAGQLGRRATPDRAVGGIPRRPIQRQIVLNCALPARRQSSTRPPASEVALWRLSTQFWSVRWVAYSW